MKKILIFSLLITLFSCGYRFPGGGGLPGGISSIDISIFENKTGFSKIDNYLKEEFVSEFSKSGLVASQEESQGVLKGEILNLKISTASKSSSDSIYEKRVTLVLNIILVDKKGNTLFERKSLSENYVYEASQGSTYGFGIPDNALIEVSDKIAKKLVSLITSDF